MIASLPMGWVHGTCVDLDGAGLLIVGASGYGKSALALALVGLGGRLVSDDQVELLPAASQENPDRVRARGKPGFEGMIEARFMGILRAPHCAETTLKLVIDLDHEEEHRLPPPRHVKVGVTQIDLILGRNIPNLAVASKLWLLSGPVR